MGKGRHGGGGFGGGGGFHGGGHHGFGGGFGGHHHMAGFHHGGPNMHHGHFGMGMNHRMFHGGPGYRGWWHPGGFGYWHGGWAMRGWFGRPCFGWFYPGWFYSWYGANLLFTGTPWFFGFPYYRPWYLPPQPSTTVVLIQQQPQEGQQQQNTSAVASKTIAVEGSSAPSAPPSYSSSSAIVPTTGAAPFGGESDAEPVLPPSYEAAVKTTIEAAFQYAAQHASVFWKFADVYPSNFTEIDTYFQRFAVQKEIDLAIFPETRIQETIGFWSRLFCQSNAAVAQKKQLLIQRIKSAYREFLLAHCARELNFNMNFSNFQIAAHALYGSISKRYANSHVNDPVVFNFEELQQFIDMLERRFGTTELAIDNARSKKGDIPYFVVLFREQTQYQSQ